MKGSIVAKACIIDEYGAEGILAARKGAGGIGSYVNYHI
jgi:hypothetical protein